MIRVNLSAAPQGAIATLGNFDGVHRGHQSMIQALVSRAQLESRPSLVIVFEPQPQEFFSEEPPARITNFDEKCRLLQELGVEYLLCLDFNAELAQLTAEDFIQTILLDALQVKHLLVGDDFRFGAQRKGDFALLKAFGEVHGFTTEGLESIMEGSERVSSTNIRQALSKGDLPLAKRLLGRPYCMRGVVQTGDQRGRLLGYPTANLDPGRLKVPLSGVYAVKIHGLGQAYQGMANLGTRPTVDGLKTLLEVNIFDFNQMIYGEVLEIEFCYKIRDEQRFESLEALKARIQADHTAVESYFHHG